MKQGKKEIWKWLLAIATCKTPKTYFFIQFTPAEMNTSGSKTPTTFIPIHTNDDYRGRLSINKDLVSCTILCYETLTIVHNL